MENSTNKTSASAFVLLFIVLAATGLAYVSQASISKKFEGTFPMVKPLIRGEFQFHADRVEIRLAEDPLPVKRIAVFAYDAQDNQVCILKPVYDRTVVLTRDDYPDYRVRLRNGMFDGHAVLRGHDREHGERTSFIDTLYDAKESGRRYGVQECLYPICTRCIDVCPVIKQGVIKMKVNEEGAFYPAIYIAGCPRSGKCIEACRQRVICRSVDLPPAAPTGIETETVPFQPLDLEKTLQHMTY